MHKKWRLYASALAMAGVLGFGTAPAFAQKYGKPGDPVKLVVGYQPYYTESWSAVVMNGKQLWKKYLPAGSDRRVPGRLQGADHRQRHDRREAAHRLRRRHAGHRRHRPCPTAAAPISASSPRSALQAAVQYLPRPQRRAAVQGRQGSGQVDGRQGHSPRRTARAPTASRGCVQAVGHHAEDLPQPEHRGHHHQLPGRQARCGGHLGADRHQDRAEAASRGARPAARTSMPSTAAFWSC